MKDMIYDEIDWEDDSGVIAFVELEKRYKTRMTTKESIKKVTELTMDDWTLLLIYSNGGSLRKTLIFSLMCIFGERTGLIDEHSFSYHNDKELSDMVDNTLKHLISTDKLELGVGKDKEDYISKIYTIKDVDCVKYLWSLLPDPIIDVLFELIREFGNKSICDVMKYTNDAYQEYAAYDN